MKVPVAVFLAKCKMAERMDRRTLAMSEVDMCTPTLAALLLVEDEVRETREARVLVDRCDVVLLERPRPPLLGVVAVVVLDVLPLYAVSCNDGVAAEGEVGDNDDKGNTDCTSAW